QSEELDNEIVEFYDFYDYIMQFFDPFESEKDEDQENLNSLEFEFSCSINISELEDKNPFISTQKWLMEELHQIIIQKESPQAIRFLTGMRNIIENSNIQIDEIGVDSTYNTNNLRFELFVVHAHVDGSGYPLAYLFLENNGNYNNGISTGILIDFFCELHLRGLNPIFFFTDKDFSQILAARFVWKNIKVQICLWHIKRAIENRLSNNNTYFTDVSNWVCGCSSFLTSCFFICKHLVLQKRTVPIKFFDQVHCHYQYPFLSTLDIQVNTGNVKQFISHNDNITNFNVIEDEESVQNSDEIYTQLINTTKITLEILEEQ
ncbi:23354_t:CDS:2, partial [Gigaspora rosea]